MLIETKTIKYTFNIYKCTTTLTPKSKRIINAHNIKQHNIVYNIEQYKISFEKYL